MQIDTLERRFPSAMHRGESSHTFLYNWSKEGEAMKDSTVPRYGMGKYLGNQLQKAAWCIAI